VRILIVSATQKEIYPFLQHLPGTELINNKLYRINKGQLSIDVLITGIGLPAAVYSLTCQLVAEKYNWVINVGVAGCFNEEHSAGSTVVVNTEQFGDLGIDDNHQFFTLFEKGLIDQNESPFHNGMLINNNHQFQSAVISSLPLVIGVTVNTTSGNPDNISKIQEKFKPDVETMEGAGIFYVCKQLQVPFIEIRSISNKVEPRNVKNWNLPLAIKNLNNTLLAIISEFEE
jgi:futalosine hydrolase